MPSRHGYYFAETGGRLYQERFCFRFDLRLPFPPPVLSPSTRSSLSLFRFGSECLACMTFVWGADRHNDPRTTLLKTEAHVSTVACLPSRPTKVTHLAPPPPCASSWLLPDVYPFHTRSTRNEGHGLRGRELRVTAPSRSFPSPAVR